jgi:hypothetical protein
MPGPCHDMFGTISLKMFVIYVIHGLEVRDMYGTILLHLQHEQ